jgi:hypothetical protein
MPRRNQWTVDAEAVQGNAGATVTFHCVTVGERNEYIASPDVDDIVMLRSHLVAWTGIVDDQDRELPSPADDPAVIDALYMTELRALARLLWAGPEGDAVKN